MIKFYSIPKWAKYISQNKEGKWYAYDHKPEWDRGNWCFNGLQREVFPIISSTLNVVIK